MHRICVAPEILMPIVFHLSTQAEVEVKRQGDPDERHGERGEQPRIATIAPRAVRTATASRTALRPRATMCRLEHIGPDLSREPRDEVATIAPGLAGLVAAIFGVIVSVGVDVVRESRAQQVAARRPPRAAAANRAPSSG